MPHATESALRGWRRHAAIAFITLWLGVQIGVPLAQKLDVETPFAPYRYARYSWAMFSRLVPRYEVSLYRLRPHGAPEPIPEIDHWVRGYRSPEPMPMRALYVSEGEVLDRFGGLVAAIARERRDGYTYVASIRWTANRPQGLTTQELRADAAR
ncbi:MAG TPA: hypothetical protein VJU81_10870 [Methylomirabilota bacterium]|nr:hypothetical protein [Methylomirabilota bacterium]